ncbi:uncharacterized protein LOC135197146 [Macrobrachium nipponense]|uniref:uncharacterized protein LOC135197146 n=1 Tax=Macrobrachium nipponense TaxID=159736 RepID=UPI0030C7F121
MLGSRRKTYAEKVPVSPLKKVTFYGPVTSRKGEQLRHVGNQAVSPRRTVFSVSQSSRSKHDIDFNSTVHLRPKSSEERPHSKTSVLGKQMKTRLNCNHTKPKCEACIASKKKAAKQRHRSLIADIPRQSHVLPSTRSHPRGSTDGRKLYDKDDGNNSLSILDATWKPGLDTYAGQQNGLDNNGTFSVNNGLKSRQSSEEGTRKKVQFVDGIANKEENLPNHSRSYIVNDSASKQSSDWHGLHRKDNSCNLQADSDTIKSDNNTEHRESERRHGYSSNKDDEYDSTTTDQDTKLGDGDTCKICDSLKRRCSKHSKIDPLLGSKRDWHPPDRQRSHSLPISSSSSEAEHCVLCQRYNKKHYYIDSSGSCSLCEVPYRNRQMPSCLHHKVPEASAQCSHHTQLRPPIHRQRSTPVFFSDGEEDYLLKRKIPYEPKTELVKDLKKKLEDDYLHREYLRKRRNFHRRWRSWDAEDLEDLRNFRQHRCENLHEYMPQHKCVHRYLQNNRLFLEPALTDEDGSSLCSECGAPKPDDPNRDPYLYHITLGGLHNKDKYLKENINMTYRDVLSNRNRSQRTSYSARDSTEKPTRETSRHAFAKLNRNVHNILPLNSHYHLQPHLADELRYRVNPHSRRHPSRSMALVDHLL